MADYYGFTRTNYFSVTDEKAFRKVIEDSYCSSGDIEIFENNESGSIKFGFGCYGEICGVREVLEDDCDEGDYDAFVSALQSVLAEGDAIIIREVGYEKLRYLIGRSHVITKSDSRYVHLQDRALAESQIMLNNPEYQTKMDY